MRKGAFGRIMLTARIVHSRPRSSLGSGAITCKVPNDTDRPCGNAASLEEAKAGVQGAVARWTILIRVAMSIAAMMATNTDHFKYVLYLGWRSRS